LRVKLKKKIKTLTKGKKIKRIKIKKIIHYKLELKGETKNNETLIKDSMKKIKKL